MNNKLYTFLSILCCSALLWTSCTKTEDLDPVPQDKILEYKVVNLPDDEVIYGAIDNQNNTITVYVPFYYGLLVIDPEIELSTGAKLSEEVLPVNIETEGHTYTVQAADGSTRTYTLHIVQQNTPSFDISFLGAPGALVPYTTMPVISGTFGHSNPQIVTVTLVNQESGERFLVNTGSGATLTPGNNYILRFGAKSVPADITAGTYTLEVKNLGHTATLGPLTVQYQQPTVYLSASLITISKASEWDIIPLTSVFLDPVKVTATVDGTDYELPIASWTRTGMKVTFPANFPTGQLSNVSIRFDFTGWESVTKTVQLNITGS